MKKLNIELTEVNIQDFYGINNKNLEYIVNQFSKLKIVARGRSITAVGTDEDLNKLKIITLILFISLLFLLMLYNYKYTPV